jgi:hypothetical protein
VRVVHDSAEGYDTEARRTKLERAERLAEVVINDPEFQDAILLYSSGDEHGFTQADRYPENVVSSNSEPLEALLGGNGPPGAAPEVHLSLAIVPKVSGGYGVTDMDGSEHAQTRTQANVYDELSVARLANHLIHEHMHRMGFKHAECKSRARCHSVPYAIGRMVCEFATRKYGFTGTCEVTTARC